MHHYEIKSDQMNHRYATSEHEVQYILEREGHGRKGKVILTQKCF